MKKLVLGISLCTQAFAGPCPSDISRCLIGIAALVGISIAGCTNNNPPPQAPYYAPTSSSSYSSSYETHSETVDGKTTTTFNGEVTKDGKTQKFSDPDAFDRAAPESRFAPGPYSPPQPE